MAGTAQTIVEYLRDKFARIDVAIPAYAMSAGTMIALGCDCIIMDRQSQLGPIDSQVFFGGRHYSDHSIVGQFETAKAAILKKSRLSPCLDADITFYRPGVTSRGPKIKFIWTVYC